MKFDQAEIWKLSGTNMWVFMCWDPDARVWTPARRLPFTWLARAETWIGEPTQASYEADFIVPAELRALQP